MDAIETLMTALAVQADATGETQTTQLSSGGWQPIIKDGKNVGRIRFAMMDITITPTKKKRKANKSKGGKQ